MTDPIKGAESARDGSGKFLPGHKLGGRKQLPDWFRDFGPDALRVLVAAATGKASDDDPPAARELAIPGACKDSVRVDAAKTVIDRVYGKVTEHVDIKGDAVATIRRVIVDADSKRDDATD